MERVAVTVLLMGCLASLAACGKDSSLADTVAGAIQANLPSLLGNKGSGAHMLAGRAEAATGDASVKGVASAAADSSLKQWAARASNMELVRSTVELLLKKASAGGSPAEGDQEARKAGERLRVVELECGSKGFEASTGVHEPTAEQGGGAAERQLRVMMVDQEKCWQKVATWCKDNLGDERDQIETCIVSVCILHSNIS